MPSSLAAPPSAARRRGRAFLTSFVCLLLGAGCWFVGTGLTLEESPQPVPSVVSAVLVLDAVLGIAAAAAVGPMRRAGAWNLVIVLFGVLSAWALPAFVVAAVRIGRLRALRTDLLAVFVALVAWLAYSLTMPRFDGGSANALVYEAAILVVVTASLLLWGRVRSTRAALITSLRAQADAAERERSAEVQRVLAEERVALARDMHDGLSHHLSLISMHAGALAYRDDISPARVREVGQTLRDSATAAHTDLRQLLLSLREQPTHTGTDAIPHADVGADAHLRPRTDADVPTRIDADPLADATSLDALITSEQDRGANVRMIWEGITAAALARAPRPLTVALERILAEALVNARKHAPSAPVTVTLSSEEGTRRRPAAEVVLRVTNPLTTRGAGRTAPSAEHAVRSAEATASVVGTAPTGTRLGLTGVAERARLLGGSAQWMQDADDFTLEARIPWTH